MSRPTANVRHERRIGAALFDLVKEAGPFVLLGLAAAIVLLLLFAKLSEEVFSNETTSLDDSIALWVHTFANPALDFIFKALSDIGGAIGVPLITAVGFALLVWRRHAHDAWRLAFAVIGGVVINEALKLHFHRTRPDLWPVVTFAGYSFPSGHATLAVCLFGTLAWLGVRYFASRAIRVGWVVLMVLMIVGIGLSRIYLGAHFPSDVVAGYLSAGLWLAILLSGIDFYYRLAGVKKPAQSAPASSEQR